MQIPRQEHPKPQFQRNKWINLNGVWQFEMDQGCSAEARGLQNEKVLLSGTILVPFCPESKLSGIEHRDFIRGACYKRTVLIPKQEDRVYLHFGAVDYLCKAYVNGQIVGTHTGGYDSFFFDITDTVRDGENEIAVFVEDDTRNPLTPSGKQSRPYGSDGPYYTRTTGIWQTVWLEFVPQSHIVSVKYYPDVRHGRVRVELQLQGRQDLNCRILFGGELMGSYDASQICGRLVFTVPLAQKHLWQIGDGKLYDVELSFGADRVKSYFGLREVCMEGKKFLLNGKSVFQRLVLDQGFYPEGIYTAPSDQALEQDIRLAQAAGFTGARLHQKVFEERYLYHADRLGYIVWGEFADWGMDNKEPMQIFTMLPQWMQVLERDFNHPSIIGWCPYNEVWNGMPGDCLKITYDITKAIDPTRPCIDVSGGRHVKSEIMDIHDYNQDPVSFRQRYEKYAETDQLDDRFMGAKYQGEPTFVSEYGGIGWSVQEGGWSYGQGPKNLEEFYERFRGLTDALLDCEKIFGFCYTQLTDVEQEQNGIYTYNREPKFDPAILREILTRKAAIEDTL